MPLRVLFVDDEPALLRVMRRTHGRQFEVETASGARDALDRLGGTPPIDVVVTDQRMPGGDGLGLIRRFGEAAVPGGSKPAFILLTGDASDPALQPARGACLVLEKPCDQATLAAAIESARPAG